MKALWAITVFTIAACIVIGVSSEAATTHPAVGKQPNRVHVYPSEIAADWTGGDLIFLDQASFPPLDQLSNIDKYILAGAVSTEGADVSQPWSRHVAMAVSYIYAVTGEVPERLTPQELRAVPVFKNASVAALDVYRNPITNDWPVLNASEYSPGNLYIRPLTESEKISYANRSIGYKMMWLHGRAPDSRKLAAEGQRQRSLDEMISVTKDMIGPVWYYRVYGEKSVLDNTFIFWMKDKE